MFFSISLLCIPFNVCYAAEKDSKNSDENNISSLVSAPETTTQQADLKKKADEPLEVRCIVVDAPAISIDDFQEKIVTNEVGAVNMIFGNLDNHESLLQVNFMVEDEETALQDVEDHPRFPHSHELPHYMPCKDIPNEGQNKIITYREHSLKLIGSRNQNGFRNEDMTLKAVAPLLFALKYGHTSDPKSNATTGSTSS